jgi:hypothetical protein
MSLQRAILTFFTTTLRFPVRDLNLAELVRPKTDTASSIMRRKSLFDGSRADLAVLPVSIQVLEGFALETTARLVAEDQFGIADRCTLFLIPRLRYAEVARKILPSPVRWISELGGVRARNWLQEGKRRRLRGQPVRRWLVP